MSLPPAVLLDRLTVKPSQDGEFAITVVLPADLVREYCHLLESLAAFFYQVNRKCIISTAQLRATSQAINHAAELQASEYRARLVSSFDTYTAAGLDRKTAIKRIGADLRADNHPWRDIDLIRSELVAAGRGSRMGRPAGRRREP